MDDVTSIHAVLSRDYICLDKEDADAVIFDQVDTFVNLSRDNETVTQVHLWIDPDDDLHEDASGTHRYDIWNKIAEGIGNLQALREITITQHYYGDDEDEDHPLAPDWEILACILRRLRRGIHLRMEGDVPLLWETAALLAFAGVIRGHTMITGFCTGYSFPFNCLDIVCSALLTLPALEEVSFKHDDGRGPEEGQQLESMAELLQSPTLREVTFELVVFTNTLSQAVAKVLEERTEITDLRFEGCSFPEGGNSVIARALKVNTTLKCLHFYNGADEVVCEVLAAALLSNTTLQTLRLCAPDGSGYNTGSCSWLSPLFLALQVNNGLKHFSIDGIELIDEKLSTAMKLGVGENSTLETLILDSIKFGDNDTLFWREAFSFLHTNTALKTLNINFEQNVTESHAATIRMEVLAMLRENESIETLFMVSDDARFEDYPVFVDAIQPNTTLKRLRLHSGTLYSDEDGKDLIPVLKKNYGLEEISGIHQYTDIHSILQLNRAGRRYLVQDGSSISKGVAVLSRVSRDINSVFLHLLENPRLCDRSAVEISSRSIGNIDNTGSTSPGNHIGGKREQQAPSHPGKETRRRLE